MAKKITHLRLKYLVLAAFLGGLLSLTLGSHGALAGSFMPLPSTENLNLPTPQGETAIQKLEDLLGPAARNLRIIMGAIAVLLIVIAGLQMVLAGDNEETYKTQRKAITYSIIGLMMLSIAGPIAAVFDYRQGNFIDSPDKFVERAQLFDSTTRLIVTFLKYLLGAMATLMFIRSGSIMVAQGSSEEAVTKEKKNLALGAAGLILVYVSDLIIRNIFYVTSFNSEADKTQVLIDQNEFVRQLVGITNLLVTFVSPILVLGIVVGGFLYVSAAGNEERTGLAKKIMLNSAIGVIILYGAFALVSTIIAGVF